MSTPLARDPSELKPGIGMLLCADKGLFSMSDRYPAVSPDGLRWTLLESHGRIPSRDTSAFTYDPDHQRWLAMVRQPRHPCHRPAPPCAQDGCGARQVKQPSRFGRSVALSTCPASDFGAFSPPELIFQADELDWENARARRAQLLADPRFYKPVRRLANPVKSSSVDDDLSSVNDHRVT